MNKENVNSATSIPLGIAEILHATLGPLASVLEEENHPWAGLVKRVVREYVAVRDEYCSELDASSWHYGVAAQTAMAAEVVCGLIREDEQGI